MTTKLKVGDRVKYTSGKYSESPSNPLWNGTYGQVKGNISEKISSSPMFDWRVNWDNGHSAVYNTSDLQKIGETIQETINRIIETKENVQM
jgi:hypothetical protein